ncbi:MAG: hypothetical protein NVSMB21_04710 [Vulcanimicrobiaceae bacterium]
MTRRSRYPALAALALAAYFGVVQFYTSFAALSPTPPVGYVFADRTVAGALVGLLVAAALALAYDLLRERARPPAPSGAILGAWIGSAALSAALGFDPATSGQVVATMALGAAFHLGLVRHYGRPGVAASVLGTYLLCGIGAGIAALAMVATRRPAALWALNHGRAAGVFVTANQCAAFAVAFGFVALGIALGRTGRLQRLAQGGVVLAVAMLAASVSQAGAIGAGAGAIFFACATGARRTALLLLVGLVGCSALFASRPAIGHNPADDFDRLRVWQAGLRVAELFPLTGAGPMQYWRLYPAIRPANGDLPGTFGALHPHDAYLSLAGETGAVGLVACGYGFWRFGRAMWTRLRARAPRERRLALGVCAALVAVLVQGIFDTIGVVQMTFVWIPYTALALATVDDADRVATR